METFSPIHGCSGLTMLGEQNHFSVIYKVLVCLKDYLGKEISDFYTSGPRNSECE